MTITVCINADTRVGYLNPQSTVGDYGEGSLQGVRSVDLLTEGVKNKMNYFRGYDCQCILCIDQHEELSAELYKEIQSIVEAYGNNSKLICKPHNRTRHRLYDYITIEALKLADGDYVVHWDQDTNGIRTDESDIIEKYFKWLDEGYKYICQPSPMPSAEHGMFWASTRFFICKKETLDLPMVEQNLTTPFMGKHTPCVEHILGALAGDGKVLYPPREDDSYLIWSWARYFQGTLKRINENNQAQELKRIVELGVHGAQDILDKQ